MGFFTRDELDHYFFMYTLKLIMINVFFFFCVYLIFDQKKNCWV